MRYLPDKGIILRKLYLEDEFNDSVTIKAEDQDFDDVHLYVPNLKNYDGNNSRRKSEISVTCTDQIISGKKAFQKSIICNEQPTQNSHLTRKDYVDTHDTNNNYLKTDGGNFMIGDLNMNEQSVKNMLDPTNEQDGVNRGFLEANGQNPMTFDLNMDNYKIVNLKNFDSSNTSDTDAVNIKYLKDTYVNRSLGILGGNLNANNNKIINLTLPTNIEDAVNKQYTDDNFLKLDGTNNMLANLNLDDNLLINVADPNSETDGVNKRYIDNGTMNKPSHSLENKCKYAMDIDEISTEYGLIADRIDNLNWSFHSNKKVIFFKAVKNGSNYRYRIGIQLTPASYNNHTICIEQFFTDETMWDKAQINISGTGVSLPYNRTTKFSYNASGTKYYIKTIIQLKKLITVSHFIYYTSHIDNVSSSSPNELQLYLVIYGTDSFLSDVDSSVYNLKPFIINGDKIQFQEDIDMNQKK